jgi:hypothetical protein
MALYYVSYKTYPGTGDTGQRGPLNITALHYRLPLPNCIYTSEGEYANCNHQQKHFKEVTHEKDIQWNAI